MQPSPAGLAPWFPPSRPQVGLRVSSVITPAHTVGSPAGAMWMPGIDQAPLQPAMFGCSTASMKPSRVPSAQPVSVEAQRVTGGGAGALGGASGAQKRCVTSSFSTHKQAVIGRPYWSKASLMIPLIAHPGAWMLLSKPSPIRR